MRFEQGAPAGVKPAVPMVQSSRHDRALHAVLPVTSPVTSPITIPIALPSTLPSAASAASPGSSISLLPRQSELRSYLRELAATRR